MLFGRYTEVAIGPSPKAAIGEALKGRIYDTGKYINGKWRQGMRIEFEVNGDSSSKSVETTIEIWNMGIFGSLFGQDSDVVLKSGYLDFYNTIFIGKVQTVEVRREGADIITKFICKEQTKDLLNVYVNASFVQGTKWMDVLKKLLSYTAVQVAFIQDDGTVVPEKRFYVTSDQSIGRWIDVIVNKKMGSDWKWYIRNGNFYAMRKNYAFPTGLRVNAKSGLISVVKADTKATGEKKDEWTLRMFLIPKVNKDTVFLVESIPESYERGKGDIITYSSELQLFKVQSFKYVSNQNEHVIEANIKKIQGTQEAFLAFREGIPYEFDEEFDEEEG